VLIIIGETDGYISDFEAGTIGKRITKPHNCGEKITTAKAKKIFLTIILGGETDDPDSAIFKTFLIRDLAS
jgi:hypothetical protein